MESLPVPLLAVAVGLALAGCAASGGSSKQPSTQTTGQSPAFGASSQWRSADPGVMQRDVMNFADRFAGNMADTYDELAARSTTPAAKAAALQRKIGNVSAAYVNASASNPIVGLIDMIVTVTLLRQASEEPWFTELFGAADAAKVVAVLKAQEADVWDIGSRYLTESQLAELRGAIDRWRSDHAGQRYVSTIRLADFPEAKSPPPADAKGPTSVFGLLQQLVGSTTRASELADAATSIADSVKRLPQTHPLGAVAGKHDLAHGRIEPGERVEKE